MRKRTDAEAPRAPQPLDERRAAAYERASRLTPAQIARGVQRFHDELTFGNLRPELRVRLAGELFDLLPPGETSLAAIEAAAAVAAAVSAAYCLARVLEIYGGDDEEIARLRGHVCDAAPVLNALVAFMSPGTAVPQETAAALVTASAVLHALLIGGPAA